MSEKEQIKTAMAQLRKLGYASRMNLLSGDVGKFFTAVAKEEKGVFLVGHDLEDAYDKEGFLRRRIYLAWIGDPEEILGVLFEKELNVYWCGRRGWAMEIRPKHEETPVMDF